MPVQNKQKEIKVNHIEMHNYDKYSKDSMFLTTIIKLNHNYILCAYY